MVDPADVRKVILEEGLFGSLEMNWIGDNSARDFQQSDAPRSMDFLLYPYAFTAGSKPDCLDPVTVRYGITAGELPA